MEEQGALKSRSDVLEALKGAGFEIARTTPKSISIKNPDGGQNIRLKGMIYEQDFRFSKELRADIERASERYRADRSNRVQEARKTLDRLTTRKRESNQQRYPRAEPTHTPDYIKNMDDRIHRYSDSNRPSMGYFDVPKPQNQQERRDYRSTEPSYPRVSKQGGQREITGLYRHQEPQETMRFSEQGRRDLEQWQSNGSNGVLNDDRIRKALARSFRTSTGTTTAEGSRFTQDVRAYTTGQSERQGIIQELVRDYENNRPDPKRELEQISQACEQFERSVTGLQETKRSLDQAITGIRNASQQVKEMNEPRQSYSRGMRY